METLQRLHNRGSISTGYEIDNSVKFEADNREYLRWTNFSNQASSARKKKFTFSVWVKRTELGGNQQVFISTSQNGYLTFEANNQLTWIQQYGGSQLVINTTRVFRDTSAWYHIMVVVDTAQSTEANRTKIYVNGVQETVFDAAAYPSQNAEASNLFEQHLIVGEWGGTSLGFCGYMAEYYFLSEIAASPTDLGEFDEDSGIWKPKEYDGTISSPSHFLEFKDGSDLGTATSGLDSDYQNNLTAADQATDTPTNNFCTMNVLNPLGVYTEGATRVTSPATPDIPWATSSFAISHGGKWYCELKLISASNSAGSNFWQNGITPHQFSDSWNYTIMYRSDGLVLNLPNSGTSTGNTSFAANDIMGMAYDSSARTLKFYKNGSLVLTKTVNVATPAGDYFFGAGATNGGTYISDWNFGGYTPFSISSAASDANGYGTFEYAPPSGYYALCTKNLEEFG